MCMDCDVVVGYDDTEYEQVCSKRCLDDPTVRAKRPALEYVDTGTVTSSVPHEVAQALVEGRHSYWCIEEDGGPGYRFDASCPWHPDSVRFDCMDINRHDGPTEERYQYEGRGKHALYVIRTYEDPDQEPEPESGNWKDGMPEISYCGCCGGALSWDDLDATASSEWCLLCEEHVEPGRAPWLATYESRTGRPCPYR